MYAGEGGREVAELIAIVVCRARVVARVKGTSWCWCLVGRKWVGGFLNACLLACLPAKGKVWWCTGGVGRRENKELSVGLEDGRNVEKCGRR